jgi:hypothetical protein
VKRWLGVLRHGDPRRQAQARARLAVVYEQRGMLAQAIEMLEANLRLGAADDWHYARLLDLYRQQGTKAPNDDAESAFSFPFADGEPAKHQSPVRELANARDDAPIGPSSRPRLSQSTPELSIMPASSSEDGRTDLGQSTGDADRQLVNPAVTSAWLLATGGIVGALVATLGFGIWHGDWRLQAAAVVIALLLAGRWIATNHGSGAIALPRPGRLPAVGGLAVLALLVSVVLLDGRSQAVADVTSAAVGSAQARPPHDTAAPEEASGMPPSVAERSTGRSALSTTRVDGVLLGANAAHLDGPASQDESSPHSMRRPDLVVVDADGGVWLRAAPGDGKQIKLLPNGTQLVGLGESQDAGGKRWRRVEEPRTGEGWIADAYVRDRAEVRRAGAARRQPLPGTAQPIAPEIAGHLATIQPRLQSVDEAVQALLSGTTRAVERPGLFADTRWKAELISQATALQERVRQLQLVGMPPELDQFSRTLAAASRDLTIASDDLVNGIDTLDPVRIGGAVDRLDRVSGQLDRASSELYSSSHGR